MICKIIYVLNKLCFINKETNARVFSGSFNRRILSTHVPQNNGHQSWKGFPLAKARNMFGRVGHQLTKVKDDIQHLIQYKWRGNNQYSLHIS